MFLKSFRLKRKSVTSNASRKLTRYSHSWFLQKKDKRFSLKKKWNAGKASNGRTVFWTKSAMLQRHKSIKINYHLRYNKFGFITSFQLIPFKNKLISLIFFANGAASYYIATRTQKIFNFWYLNYFKKLKRFLKKTIFAPIARIKKLTYISMIEITPGKGAQYCRSAGTSARLFKITPENQSALVHLPSGVKKLFSYYSFACIGYVKLKNHKKYKNTRAGYWRSFGCKPVVRGVAMNPVDHPHGGRTKAIKYPRTPWGKTTKFK